MNGPLRILHLEDDRFDGELLKRMLTQAGLVREWVRVETSKDFLAALKERAFDMVLSDYTLPSFNGIEALDLTRQHNPDVPFIFVSGTIDEDVAVESLKKGAADYVFKNRLSRLVPAVRRAVQDVADRAESRRAEQCMRESERKYRQVFESMGEAAFLIDLGSGRVLDANQRAESLIGRPRSEIIGLKHEKFHVPEKIGHYRDVLANVLETNNHAEVESAIVTKDGRTIPVRIRASTLELYGHRLILGLYRDVSERKHIEEQLHEQERLLDLLPEAIVMSDLEGHIRFWNDAAACLYGWRREEVLGRKMTELLSTDASEFDAANHAALQEGEWQGDLHQWDREHHELMIHSRWMVMRNDRNEPQAILLLNSAISPHSINRLQPVVRRPGVLHGVR